MQAVWIAVLALIGIGAVMWLTGTFVLVVPLIAIVAPPVLVTMLIDRVAGGSLPVVAQVIGIAATAVILMVAWYELLTAAGMMPQITEYREQARLYRSRRLRRLHQ